MDDPTSAPPDAAACECPSCGHVMATPSAGQNLLQCPNCGEQFFIHAESAPEAEAVEDPPSAGLAESEISELRIREVMHARQAMYRSRRWPIVFAAASVMALAKFIQIAIVGIRHGQRLIPAADLIAAVIALFLAIHFAREVVRITRQIRSMRQPDPVTPPDFSTLSDGSHHWKNLEKLTDPEP